MTKQEDCKSRMRNFLLHVSMRVIRLIRVRFVIHIAHVRVI